MTCSQLSAISVLKMLKTEPSVQESSKSKSKFTSKSRLSCGKWILEADADASSGWKIGGHGHGLLGLGWFGASLVWSLEREERETSVVIGSGSLSGPVEIWLQRANSQPQGCYFLRRLQCCHGLYTVLPPVAWPAKRLTFCISHAMLRSWAI
jgi:hypothetical protein